MPLPVLPSHHATPADLVRLYLKAELDLSRHVAEETLLDIGTAFTGPKYPGVRHANRMLDASLPPGVAPQQALAEVDSHFQSMDARCLEWVINPSLPPAQTQPLIDHLAASRHVRNVADILYLARSPVSLVQHVSSLQIIPARASFKHTRVLIAEDAADVPVPALVDAKMEHLDDPHVDGLTALRDGQPVAHVSVLAMGEVGCIMYLFVSAKFRGQGIGKTMMSRALEICARSLFRHVFLSVYPDNGPAQSLYAKLGFRKVGEYISYIAPSQ